MLSRLASSAPRPWGTSAYRLLRQSLSRCGFAGLLNELLLHEAVQKLASSFGSSRNDRISARRSRDPPARHALAQHVTLPGDAIQILIGMRPRHFNSADLGDGDCGVRQHGAPKSRMTCPRMRRLQGPNRLVIECYLHGRWPLHGDGQRQQPRLKLGTQFVRLAAIVSKAFESGFIRRLDRFKALLQSGDLLLMGDDCFERILRFAALLVRQASPASGNRQGAECPPRVLCSLQLHELAPTGRFARHARGRVSRKDAVPDP